MKDLVKIEFDDFKRWNLYISNKEKYAKQEAQSNSDSESDDENHGNPYIDFSKYPHCEQEQFHLLSTTQINLKNFAKKKNPKKKLTQKPTFSNLKVLKEDVSQQQANNLQNS